MILTAAPYRVSLFGGGSDYPEWFNEHGGCVLGMAINRYCYVSLKSLPQVYNFCYRVAYQKVEDVQHVSEIQHPAVRGVLQHLRVNQPLEVICMGDMPARAGLGASSAFVATLLLAVRTLTQRQLLPPYERQIVSAYELADEAIHVERNVINEAVGCQDQTFAAHGGILSIHFSRNGRAVHTLNLSSARRQKLEDSMVIVYSGKMRNAHEMAAKQIAAIHRNGKELSLMTDMARSATNILTDESKSLDDIGELLNDAWRLKRALCADISSPDIDALYTSGLTCGALGGKLLGAGGGGYILFYVPDYRRKQFIQAIETPCVTFKVADQGARVVIDEP